MPIKILFPVLNWSIHLTMWAGHLTARSDVYSFGVVLLELLTGRRSVDKTRPSKEHSLVDWARPKLNDKRKLLQIIDLRLEGQYSVRAAQKACSLAYYCLSQNPKARPLMSDVVETLEPLLGSGPSDGPIQTIQSFTTSRLPDYRTAHGLTRNGVNCRASPSTKCSPAVPACRVRWVWVLFRLLQTGVGGVCIWESSWCVRVRMRVVVCAYWVFPFFPFFVLPP